MKFETGPKEKIFLLTTSICEGKLGNRKRVGSEDFFLWNTLFWFCLGREFGKL